MKRGGPLKRSGSQRKSPLVPKTPMRRASELAQRAVKAKRTKVTPEERSGRKTVSERSGGTCEVDGVNPAREKHHRRNRSQGGTWGPENLLDVCSACHLFITTHPKIAWEQGWAVPSTRNPADVPVWVRGREFVFLTADGGIQQVEDEGAA